MFDVGGRPAESTGDQHKRVTVLHGAKGAAARRVFYRVLVIRFLDGRQPAQQEITMGKWAKCRRIGGSQAAFWRRVDSLVRIEGMTADMAKAKALAEGWAE